MQFILLDVLTTSTALRHTCDALILHATKFVLSVATPTFDLSAMTTEGCLILYVAPQLRSQNVC